MTKLKQMIDGLRKGDDLDTMTKQALAPLLVDAKMAAGVIGTPADREDYEAHLVKTLREDEMIDSILLYRSLAQQAVDSADVAEATEDAHTYVTPWPESTTPIAMTLEESDAMRLDDGVVPRSFTEAWMLDEMPQLDPDTQRAIDEQVDRYADEYDDLDDEFEDVWTPGELQEHLYREAWAALDDVDRLSDTERVALLDDEATSGVCLDTSEWTDEDIKAIADALASDEPRQEDGEATIFMHDPALDDWTDEDEKALSDLHSLWAYEYDDDDAEEALADEWTEWLVLAGELERVDSGDEQATPVWAWCPDWRAELPGSDKPFAHLDDAKAVFDAYDPMGLWFTKRHIEAMAGEEPQLWRRYEVDLVCQTCSRDADGIISVRDDAVRLSKTFDVDSDEAARTLIASILSHI